MATDGNRQNLARTDRGAPALVAGALLVLFGLACNERLLLWLLGAHEPLSPAMRLEILLFELGCIGAGLLLVLRRRRFTGWWRRARVGQAARQRLAAHPRLVALALGMVSATALVVGLERAAGPIVAARPTQCFAGGYTQRFFQGDLRLGYRPRPDCRVDSVLTIDGVRVYSVTYTIDPLSRRVTPRPFSTQRTTALVFFGGSYVFGEGVEDDETLPAQVVRQLPTTTAYNYGFSGYGPQQMLMQVTADGFDREIVEPRARAVYLFIDNHVRRAIGAMSIAATWGSGFPCFGLDEDDNLLQLGTFATAHPRRMALYRWLRSRQLVQLTNLDLPLSVTRSDLHLTARIIAAAARAFTWRYGPGTFTVVLFPGSTLGAPLRRELEGSSARVLDLSQLFDPTDQRLIRRADTHPTPAGHRALADGLVQALCLEAGAVAGLREHE